MLISLISFTMCRYISHNIFYADTIREITWYLSTSIYQVFTFMSNFVYYVLYIYSGRAAGYHNYLFIYVQGEGVLTEAHPQPGPR